MTDDRLDILIAGILRWGVSLSAATVLAGGVWYLLANLGRHPDYSRFQPIPGLGALVALPASEVVMLAGLLVLIATPVARVVFSVFAFGAQRDWMYVVCTLIVLGILAGSIIGGL